MGTAAYIRQWWTPRRWWGRALRFLSRDRHPFDRRHHVETSGLLYADRLATGHEHDRHSAGYYATAPSLFRGSLLLWTGTLAASGLTLPDYSLVDIGCGKGRAVMLASEYGFREVIGVELNPALAAVARSNLRKWMRHARACRNLRIVAADALTWSLPDGPVALFFFNSFEQEMTKMWLSRLAQVAATRTSPIDLIYVHPEFDAFVRQTQGMEPLAHADIAFAQDDVAADTFGVDSDRCAIYRLAGLPRRT